MKTIALTRLTPLHAMQAAKKLLEYSVVTDSGCVEWTASLTRKGYGKMWLYEAGARKMTSSHRAAYLLRWPIYDSELVLDHLCRNRACVNVDHLELVSRAENTRRGSVSGDPFGRPKLSPDQLHSCGKHGRADGYDKTRPDGYSYWACRVCRREISARQRIRAKQK